MKLMIEVPDDFGDIELRSELETMFIDACCRAKLLMPVVIHNEHFQGILQKENGDKSDWTKITLYAVEDR